MAFSIKQGLSLAGNALASVGKAALNHVTDKTGTGKIVSGVSSAVQSIKSGVVTPSISGSIGDTKSTNGILKKIYEVIFGIFQITQQNGRIAFQNNTVLEDNREISNHSLKLMGQVAKNTSVVSEEIKKQNEREANKTDLFSKDAGMAGAGGPGGSDGGSWAGAFAGVAGTLAKLGQVAGLLLAADSKREYLERGYKAASRETEAEIAENRIKRKKAALAVEDPSTQNIVDQIDDGNKTAEQANREATHEMLSPLEGAAAHVTYQVGKGAAKAMAAAPGGNAVSRTVNSITHPVQTLQRGKEGAVKAAKGLTPGGVASSVALGEVAAAGTSGMLEGFGVDPEAAGIAGTAHGMIATVGKATPAGWAIAGTEAFAASMLWGSAALGMHDDTKCAADQDKQNLLPEERLLYDKFIRPNIDKLLADGDVVYADEMYRRWKQALQQIRVMTAVEYPAPTPWRAADVLKPEEASKRSWKARQLDLRPQAIERKLDRLGLWDTTQFFKDIKIAKEKAKKEQERTQRVDSGKARASRAVSSGTIDKSVIDRGRQLKREYDYMRYAKNTIRGEQNQIDYLKKKGFTDEQLQHFAEFNHTDDQYAHFYSEEDEIAFHAYEEYERSDPAARRQIEQQNAARIRVNGFISKMKSAGSFNATGDKQKDSRALQELFAPYFKDAQKTKDQSLIDSLNDLYKHIQKSYGLDDESAEIERGRLAEEQAIADRLTQEARYQQNMLEISEAEKSGLMYHVYEEEYGLQTGKILHFSTLKEKNDYLRSQGRESDIGEIEPELRQNQSEEPSSDDSFFVPSSTEEWGFDQSKKVSDYIDQNEDARIHYERMREFYLQRGNDEWDADEKAQKSVYKNYMSPDDEKVDESGEPWYGDYSHLIGGESDGMSQENTEALNATAEATVNSEQTLRNVEKQLTTLVELATQPGNKQNADTFVPDGGNIR